MGGNHHGTIAEFKELRKLLAPPSSSTLGLSSTAGSGRPETDDSIKKHHSPTRSDGSSDDEARYEDTSYASESD